MTKEVLKHDEARLAVYLNGPDWDGVPSATIGDFSCKSIEAGSDLLQEAIELVRQRGRNRILGPMAGDTWHSYRFVSESDGSPPFLLEPTNKPWEPEVFLDAGFQQVGRYFSARLDLAGEPAPAPPASQLFEIETWDGKDPEKLFRQVFDLSSKAFSRNAFYKPIDEDEFLAMYLPVVPMIRKELIFFARRPDRTLAGFLFAIPNFAEGPETRTVIIKTYASLQRGAGRSLIYACQSAAKSLGFERAIHALIHDDNQSAERSAAEGAEIFRRYELLGLRLDG